MESEGGRGLKNLWGLRTRWDMTPIWYSLRCV